MINIIVAILTALIVTMCTLKDSHADELNLGGVSHHFRHDKEHNDLNFGLGYGFDFDRGVGLEAGAYANSEYVYTYYALVRYQPFEFGPVRAGALAGAVTGYSHCNHRHVCPAALPALSVDLSSIVLTVVAVPSIGNFLDGVVSLQLGVKLP